MEHLDVASLIRASLKGPESRGCLSEEEMTAAELAADEMEKDSLTACTGLDELKASLSEYWTTGLHPKEYCDRRKKSVSVHFLCEK
jgi:hypothetical protein